MNAAGGGEGGGVRTRARDGATSTRDAVDAAVAIVLFEGAATVTATPQVQESDVVRDVNFLIGV